MVRLILRAELLVVGLWMLEALSMPATFSSLGRLFLVAIFCGGCVVAAGVGVVRQPETWRLGVGVVATPVVGFLTVTLVSRRLGLPLLDWRLLAAAPVALAIGAILFAPHVVSRWLPAVCVESRAFNRFVLGAQLALVAGWVLPLLVVSGSPLDSTLRDPDRNGWLIVSWIAAWTATVVTAPTVLVYGWLGLFRPGARGQRGLLVGQLAVAVLLLGIFVPATWLASVVLVNPG